MQKNIELIRFNMTDEMESELINFNKIKKELTKLEALYKKDSNKNLDKEIELLKTKLNESRDNFVREFRINNVHEIEEYLELKSQNY